MSGFVRLTPDPNERACVDCKQHFNPYSMAAPSGATDGLPIIVPPVNYKCMSCRAKVTT